MFTKIKRLGNENDLENESANNNGVDHDDDSFKDINLVKIEPFVETAVDAKNIFDDEDEDNASSQVKQEIKHNEIHHYNNNNHNHSDGEVLCNGRNDDENDDDDFKENQFVTKQNNINSPLAAKVNNNSNSSNGPNNVLNLLNHNKSPASSFSSFSAAPLPLPLSSCDLNNIHDDDDADFVQNGKYCLSFRKGGSVVMSRYKSLYDLILVLDRNRTVSHRKSLF